MSMILLGFVEQLLEGLCGILPICWFFPDKRRRESGWQLLQGMIFLCIVVLNTWNSLYGFISTLAVIIIIVMYTIWIKWSFQVPVWIALSWEIFYCCSRLLLKTMILLFYAYINHCSVLYVNKKVSFSMLVLDMCFLILLCGGSYYIYRNKKFSCLLEKLIKNKQAILIITGIIEYFLVLFLFNIGQYNVGILETITGTICIFCIVILFWIQLLSTQYQIITSEKAIISIQKSRMEQQFLFLKKQYEDSRKKLHDQKYESQRLLNFLSKGDIDGARSFTENLLDQVIDLQKQITYTGQTEIDVLLSVSRQQCMEKNIDFQVNCNVLYEIPIKMSDMYILMGNLLDNAMEAAEKCSEHSRYIMLTLKLVNEMLLLKISNSYLIEPVQKADGSFRSSKSGYEHGWGLESVRDIVKENEGTMDIKFAKNKFDITILM